MPTRSSFSGLKFSTAECYRRRRFSSGSAHARRCRTRRRPAPASGRGRVDHGGLQGRQSRPPTRRVSEQRGRAAAAPTASGSTHHSADIRSVRSVRTASIIRASQPSVCTAKWNSSRSSWLIGGAALAPPPARPADPRPPSARRPATSRSTTRPVAALVTIDPAHRALKRVSRLAPVAEHTRTDHVGGTSTSTSPHVGHVARTCHRGHTWISARPSVALRQSGGRGKAAEGHVPACEDGPMESPTAPDRHRLRPPRRPGRGPGEHPGRVPPGPAPGRHRPRKRRLADRGRGGRPRPRRRGRAGRGGAGPSPPYAAAQLPAHIPTLAELYDSLRHRLSSCRSTSRTPAPLAPVIDLAGRAGRRRRRPAVAVPPRSGRCWPAGGPDCRPGPAGADSTALGRIPEGLERRAAPLAAAGVDALNLHAASGPRPGRDAVHAAGWLALRVGRAERAEPATGCWRWAATGCTPITSTG